MRGLSLVLLAAAVALADDAPPVPKTLPDKLMPWSDWVALLDRVKAMPGTTVERTAALRTAAANPLLLWPAKILDIRPQGSSVEITAIDVTGGGAPFRLAIDPSDAEVVKKWGRWDRITVEVRPRYESFDSIRYETITTMAASLSRTPNPGIEYPPPPKGTRDSESFHRWLDAYRRAANERSWDDAARLLAESTTHTWTLAGITVGAPGDGRSVSVRLTGDNIYNGFVTVKEFGRAPRTERTDRCWGIDAAPTPCPVRDPQALELLVADTKVMVYVRLRPNDAETHWMSASTLKRSDGKLWWDFDFASVVASEKKEKKKK